MVGPLGALGCLQRQHAHGVAYQTVQSLQHDDADVILAHHAVLPQLDVLRAVPRELCPQHAGTEVVAPQSELANPIPSVGATCHGPGADPGAAYAGVRHEHRHVTAHLETEASLGVGIALRVGVSSAHTLDRDRLRRRRAFGRDDPSAQVERPHLVREWILVPNPERIVPLVVAEGALILVLIPCRSGTPAGGGSSALAGGTAPGTGGTSLAPLAP